MPPTIPSYRRFGFAATIASAAALLLIPNATLQAQESANPDESAAPPNTVMHYLKTLRYDTTQNVPLMVVNPAQLIMGPTLPEHSISLATLAEASHLRILNVGNLNTLVPLTMTQITTNPGKPDLFAGMPREEMVKVLLGTLTSAQWQLLGSADGIGAGDLDKDQRPLWDDIFNGELKVHKSVLKRGEEPNTWDYTQSREVAVADMSAVRLRVSKQVYFDYSTKESDAYDNRGEPYHDEFEGQVVYSESFQAHHAQQQGSQRRIFGVDLLTDVPSADKPGDVDFASSSLEPRVNLHFELKPALKPSRNPGFPDDESNQQPTVGELLERINETTHLRFVADRRVRELPVYLRGDYAHAGDLLHGLARSVCGTFRKIPAATPDEPAIYLLTDDRKGLGTRAARLTDWCADASLVRSQLARKAARQSAKLNPLASLAFAPDDKYALTPSQSDAIENIWRNEEGGETPEVKWADLTSAQQQGIQNYRHETQSNDMRADHIRFGEGLCAYLIIPGVGAVKSEDLGRAIGGQYIEGIAFDPSPVPAKPAAPRKPAVKKAFAWPTTLKRRCLVASATTPEDAEAIVRSAGARGFTDIWLQVGVADPAASAKMLEAGVRAGTGAHVAVGVSVTLLRGGGMPGEPERNLLGETGTELKAQEIKRRTATNDPPNPGDVAEVAGIVSQYEGWTAPPDAPTLAAHILPLAAVPGLAALTLRDSAAPGWTASHEGGDDLWNDGTFGYSLTTRRAFLLTYGIDPIDIAEPEASVTENIGWLVGYFGNGHIEGMSRIAGNYYLAKDMTEAEPDREKPSHAFAIYRARANTALLAGLYRELRRARPTLPLYLDDRLSPFAVQSPQHVWFGSWDAGDRLPDNPPFYGEHEVMVAARSRSHTLFAFDGEPWQGVVGTPSDNPVNFARYVGELAGGYLPPRWDGFALDLPSLPAKDLLRVLAGLPPVSVKAKAAGDIK